MARVPLASVIGILVSLIVLVVAAITLTITYQGGQSAIRDVGTSYAAAVIDTASFRAGDLFDRATNLQNYLQNLSYPTPANDSALSAPFGSPATASPLANKWLRMLGMIAAVGGADIIGQTVFFTDGGMTALQSADATNWSFIFGDCGQSFFHAGMNMSVCPTISCQGNLTYPESGCLRNTRAKLNPNYALLGRGGALFGFGLLTQGGTIRQTVEYPMGPFLWSGRYFMTWTLLKTLYDRSGSLVGYHALTFDIVQLNEFIRSLRVTPNTEVFFTDGISKMVASSHPAPMWSYTSWTGTPPDPVPSGCDDTSRTNAANAEGRTYCRYRTSEYGYAPLAALGRDVTESTSQKSLMLVVDGRHYFVAVDRPGMDVRTSSLRVISIIPENDVIGAMVRSRNVSIGITVAVFVVAVLATFALLHVFLRPLDDISLRMYAAASFNDAEGLEPENFSSISEIYALQASYTAMNKQLNRIKAFVPMSVLRAEDDEEAECLMEEDAAGRSVHSKESLEKAPSGANDTSSTKENTEDTRSRHSRRTLLSVGAVGIVHGPNLGLHLTKKNVSVLVTNLRGFHEWVAGHTADDIVGRYRVLCEVLVKAASDNRGNVDTFNGDHFHVSFNAAGSCALHAKRAAATAWRVIHEMAQRKSVDGRLDVASLPITAGIATGPAMVGNLGCEAMKRHSGLGAVYVQAAALERLCKGYTVAAEGGRREHPNVLVQKNAFAEVETAFALQVLDIVQLPRGTERQRIAAIRGERGNDTSTGADDEWLYVVGGGSPFTAVNQLFEDVEKALASKDGMSVVEAAELAKRCADAATNCDIPEVARDAVVLAALAKGAASAAAPTATGAALGSALGRYFDEML